jgi:hypothetical protein
MTGASIVRSSSARDASSTTSANSGPSVPSCSTAGGVTSRSVMRSPLTQAPFVLARSRMRYASPSREISAWYSETTPQLPLSTTTSLSGARPMRITPSSAGTRVPANGPGRDNSQTLPRELTVPCWDIVARLSGARGALFSAYPMRPQTRDSVRPGGAAPHNLLIRMSRRTP